MKAKAILETIVYGEDIAALRRFYEGVIGLRVRRELADQFVFFHCGDGMLLVFNPVHSAVKPKSFTSAPPHGAKGAGHVCFAATSEELDRWRKHLAGHGITIEADFEWPGGGYSIYCRDPAGNSVEFAEPRIWGLPMRNLRNQKLVVASHNPGKVKEINELLGPYGVEAVSAGTLGLPEPEETGTTFEANAQLKSEAAAKGSKLVAIADDSGLCVDALNGDPGIYSARWAGPTKDFALAMRNVEEKLQAAGATTPQLRKAHFVSVLSVAWPDGHVENFEGKVHGTLVWPPRGKRGFGYDPMFLPEGRQETFGEMDPDAKHEISHRAVAFRKLVDALF